jgi:hypothetical protein
VVNPKDPTLCPTCIAKGLSDSKRTDPSLSKQKEQIDSLARINDDKHDNGYDPDAKK